MRSLTARKLQQLENSLSGSFQLVAIACRRRRQCLSPIPFGRIGSFIKTICHQKLWNCVWPMNNDGSAKKVQPCSEAVYALQPRRYRLRPCWAIFRGRYSDEFRGGKNAGRSIITSRRFIAACILLAE